MSRCAYITTHVLTLFCDRKPKNARSKRALQAREPKEVEDPRTAIFVKGTHAGERVNAAMKELVRICSHSNCKQPYSAGIRLYRWP